VGGSTSGGSGLGGGSGGSVPPVDPPPNDDYTQTVDGVPIDMVFVEGGTYQRGCDDCAELFPPNGQDDKIYEAPQHAVTVSDYHVGKYEVTIQQWKAVMGDRQPANEIFGSDDSPVIGTNWFDANAFACKLNELTGRSYRLLTDAEWEFAARGGNVGVPLNHRFSGSNNADDVAWHAGNSDGRVHPVGTKAPNELGVHDMSGNSFEWVFDWLTAYSGEAQTNPVQLTGTGNKCRRGGQYGEPLEFARVSRRAIRSRDGGAGMGFRIGHSANSFEMEGPCAAANPPASDCEGGEYRDCRLITAENEVWQGESLGGGGAGDLMLVSASGAAVIGGSFASTSGDWYTLNDRSFNIVAASGITTTYAYYAFSATELTMIGSDGMPYRLYKKPASEVAGTIPSLPSAHADLDQLVAIVEPARRVSAAELAEPDKTLRDARLVPADGKTWFMDGRCCGGNHKYRFHLQANGEAEFVVMDYDASNRENILAKGTWFTSGNIALHIELDGGYYNYLYTVGERTMSTSEYMPAGPIYSHISFQHYERGDFRIFSTYDDAAALHRTQTSSNPVYEPEIYQANSGGN
jgi:formylglycine-generating enzyme required for sulfatase activity